MNSAIIHKGAQKGSVLIVSMLILLVLTLIGVTAMGTSALEEKMAGNSRDQNQAFQAAEAALRDAEVVLNGIVSSAAFNAACTNGLCAQGINPVINAATWTGANSQVYAGPTLPGISTPPRYVIQIVNVIGSTPSPTIANNGGVIVGNRVTLFLITARGTGGTDNATVILREHFGRVGI